MKARQPTKVLLQAGLALKHQQFASLCFGAALIQAPG